MKYDSWFNLHCAGIRRGAEAMRELVEKEDAMAEPWTEKRHAEAKARCAEPPAPFRHGDSMERYYLAEADRIDFGISAREWLPDALAEIERLRAERDALRASIPKAVEEALLAVRDRLVDAATRELVRRGNPKPPFEESKP